MNSSVWAGYLRPQLARFGVLKRGYAVGRRLWDDLRSWHWKPSFEQLSAHDAVRMAYNVMLDREPDPSGLRDFTPRVRDGSLSRADLVGELRASSEFENHRKIASLGPSVHAGRVRFVRGLPKASRILDIGGTDLGSKNGALVQLGYPYPFERLTIIDLPPDERHPLYHGDAHIDEVATPLGPVSYHYHSMTDLSAFADESFDLVYSGQSIEHVSEDEGDSVFEQVHRVLRPGGWFALDTPNGRLTRLQQDEFIDPDHEVEYTLDQLADKAKRFGFELREARGLNYGGQSLAAGRFSEAEVAGNHGIYAEAADCYILALVLQRP